MCRRKKQIVLSDISHELCVIKAAKVSGCQKNSYRNREIDLRKKKKRLREILSENGISF